MRGWPTKPLCLNWLPSISWHQAEHDPLASCYLVTFSAEYADAVEAAIEKHMEGSTRAEITTASLTNKA